MKYLKTYENHYYDAKMDNIIMPESEYFLLKDMIWSVLNIIGFSIEDKKFTSGELGLNKPNEKKSDFYRLIIKLDFRSVENSTLWFICKSYLNEEEAREGYKVTLLSTKFIEPASDMTIGIRVDNESQTKATDIFKSIIGKLLNYITTDTSDNRICIGDNSRFEYPIFKKVIVDYFKHVLNQDIEMDSSIFSTIKEYISNLPNAHSLFNLIKNNNPYLYSKFQDEDTEKSSDLGGMGFND